MKRPSPAKSAVWAFIGACVVSMVVWLLIIAAAIKVLLS